MLNLIKMNLYRLFKTRVFYVMLLITVIGAGLLSGLETSGDVTSEASFEHLYADFAASGHILIMVGVFGIVFSEEERKSGFLKNLLTTHKEKKNIYAAKIPVVFLYSLVMFLGSLIACRLGSFVWGAGTYPVHSVGSLIRFITFEVILHTVFGIAMMTLYEITRNTIIPVIITVFGAANLHGMLFYALEGKLVSMWPSLKGFMEKYALSSNFIVTKAKDLGNIEMSFSYVNIIVVIVIGLIFYSVIGMCIFTKRDTI